MENQDWAAGPPGREAVTGRRPRDVGGGPPGRWAVAGRGPLGRGPAFSKTPPYLRSHIDKVFQLCATIVNLQFPLIRQG